MRLDARVVVGWLTSVVVAGLVGFWGGWLRTNSQWRLEPLPPPPPQSACPGLTAEWGPNQLWNSLWVYSPGDDAAREDIRLIRRGRDAELIVLQDGHFDDSVETTKDHYWLRWSEPGGWAVTACRSTVLKCARELMPGAPCD